MNIGLSSGALVALIGALALFGVAYNWLVGWMERHDYQEGYVSLLVALGTVATLGAVAVVDWRAALLSSGAFCITGAPMIIGSIVRHMRARARSQEAVRREALRR